MRLINIISYARNASGNSIVIYKNARRGVVNDSKPAIVKKCRVVQSDSAVASHSIVHWTSPQIHIRLYANMLSDGKRWRTPPHFWIASEAGWAKNLKVTARRAGKHGMQVEQPVSSKSSKNRHRFVEVSTQYLLSSFSIQDTGKIGNIVHIKIPSWICLRWAAL